MSNHLRLAFLAFIEMTTRLQRHCVCVAVQACVIGLLSLQSQGTGSLNRRPWSKAQGAYESLSYYLRRTYSLEDPEHAMPMCHLSPTTATNSLCYYQSSCQHAALYTTPMPKIQGELNDCTSRGTHANKQFVQTSDCWERPASTLLCCASLSICTDLVIKSRHFKHF